jgi:hypothetical protein
MAGPPALARRGHAAATSERARWRRDHTSRRVRYPLVTGQLRHVDDEGPTRCSYCSAEAAGPCASCRKPVCGDCSTLTEGGAQVWAICLDCDRKKGRSLAGAWGSFGLWMFGLLFLLAGVVALLSWIWPTP